MTQNRSHYGDVVRVTVGWNPSGYYAKAECLQYPISGYTTMGNDSTAIGAIKKAFKIAEQLSEQKLVEARVLELLEQSKAAI